jgi:hypothetical protein
VDAVRRLRFLSPYADPAPDRPRGAWHASRIQADARATRTARERPLMPLSVLAHADVRARPCRRACAACLLDGLAGQPRADRLRSGVDPRKGCLPTRDHPHRAEDRHTLVAPAMPVHPRPTFRARDGQHGLHQPGLVRNPACPHSAHLCLPTGPQSPGRGEGRCGRVWSNHATVRPPVSGDRPNLPQGGAKGPSWHD